MRQKDGSEAMLLHKVYIQDSVYRVNRNSSAYIYRVMCLAHTRLTGARKASLLILMT